MKFYKDSTTGKWILGTREGIPAGTCLYNYDSATELIVIEYASDRTIFARLPYSEFLKENGTAYASKAEFDLATADFFVKPAGGIESGQEVIDALGYTPADQDDLNSAVSGFLGTIAYNATAPAPGKSGYYELSTSGAISWISGTPVGSIGQKIYVNFTSPSTYVYSLGNATIFKLEDKATSDVKQYVNSSNVITGYAHSTGTGNKYADANYNTVVLPVKGISKLYISASIGAVSILLYNDYTQSSATKIKAINLVSNTQYEGFQVANIDEATCKSIAFNIAVAIDYSNLLAFSSSSVINSDLLLGRSFFSTEAIGKYQTTIRTKDNARLAVSMHLRCTGVMLVRFSATRKPLIEVFKNESLGAPISDTNWINDTNWETIYDASNSYQTQINTINSNLGLSKYSALKFNFLGDSLTWYGFEETYGTGWCLGLMDDLNISRANAYSYGVGGNRLCVNASGNVDEAAGGITPVVAGYHHATTNKAMVIRYAEMRDDADVVVVLTATNDVGVNQLGTINDAVLTTVYGAYKSLIQGLANKYKGKPIIYATLLHASTLDSVRMQFSQAVRECCNLYGVQYVELSNGVGIGSLNIGITTNIAASTTWSITGNGINASGVEAVADGWMGNPALTNYIPIVASTKYYCSINQYYCFYDGSYNPVTARASKQSILFQTLNAPANAIYMRLMSINTGGNLPTGLVIGDINGVALPDGIHPGQWGHDKIRKYFFNEIKKFLPI